MGRRHPHGALEPLVTTGNQPAVPAESVRDPERGKLENRPDRIVMRSNKPVTPTAGTTGTANEKLRSYKPKAEIIRPTRSPAGTATIGITGALIRRPARRTNTGRIPTQKRNKTDRAGNLTYFSALNDAKPSVSSFSKQPMANAPKADQIAVVKLPEGATNPEPAKRRTGLVTRL